MNRLFIPFLILITATACQPAATANPIAVPPTNPPVPTSTPLLVETLAASSEDLIGTWWFSKSGVKVEIVNDGTYRVIAGSEVQDEGAYSFDAGKLTWVTGHPTCDDQPATYKAYVTTQDGTKVSLRLELVGDDPCRARVEVTTKGNARFQKP